MPYTQDSATFQRLVQQVINSQDMRQRVIDVSQPALMDFLQKREPEIWAAAAPQINQYNDAEKQKLGAESDYLSLRTHKPYFLRFVEGFLQPLLSVLSLSLFALLSSTVRHFVALAVNYVRVTPWILFVAGTLILVFVLAWILNLRNSRAYTAALAQVREARSKLTQDAERARALIKPAVVAAITAYINQHLDQVARPPFRLDLPDTDTKGFSEVPNQGFEIITDARHYIRGLLEKMNGGSLGVAGPRGCGKTTLLRSFHQEGGTDEKKLTIFATAPIQYEPREFLLHLFTSLCFQVISKETKTPEPAVWNEMDKLREISSPSLLNSGVLASFLLLASILLLFSAAVLIAVQTKAGPSTPSASSTPNAGSQKPDSNSPPGQQKPVTPAINPLNSSAFPYLIWGSAALALGIFLRMAPGQPRPTGALDFFFHPWVRESRRRKKEKEQQHAATAGLGQETIDLVNRARRTLRGLRFQQSYSSGWSGTLKLPIGIEGGTTAAVSFAENQLSLPELVHQYREFLEAAAGHYDRILVAIDELDKLESDKAAKMFLNNIKAIFGQEKVYYLVSISENAMSNFERRGLPIRDEFDSSFDDAVHIGYLDADASARLLALRAGEPPPDAYRAFCYVLSGGLPRDLIRYCRKVYDYRRDNQNQPNQVAVTCPALMVREIKAKLDAIRYNLQRVPNEKKTADVLNLITKTTWNQNALRETIANLHVAQSNLESEAVVKNTTAKGSDTDLLALANIIEEIKAYLSFSLAVIEIFESMTSEARYLELKGALAFDRLALARQSMAVNRAAAIVTIAQVVPLPIQLAAVPAAPGQNGVAPQMNAAPLAAAAIVPNPNS